MSQEGWRRSLWAHFIWVSVATAIIGGLIWFITNLEEYKQPLVAQVGSSLLGAGLVGMLLKMAQFHQFVNIELERVFLDQRYIDTIASERKREFIERCIKSLTGIDSTELNQLIREGIIKRMDSCWKENFLLEIELSKVTKLGLEVLHANITTSYHVVNHTSREQPLFQGNLVARSEMEILPGLEDLPDQEITKFDSLIVDQEPRQAAVTYDPRSDNVLKSFMNYQQMIPAGVQQVHVKYKETSLFGLSDYYMLAFNTFTNGLGVIVSHPDDIEVLANWSFTGEPEKKLIDVNQTENTFRLTVNYLAVPGNAVYILWRRKMAATTNAANPPQQ